jgi:hypothetical protein
VSRTVSRPSHPQWASLWGSALIAAILLTGTVLGLAAMGRPWICTCGFVTLWHGDPNGPQTSQHLTDWYTFTHIVHGALFYGAAWAFGRMRGRPIPKGAAFLFALALECAWELTENTPAIVERYRAGTIALGYEGDSIVNSVSDILAMAAGFGAAATLPVVVVVTAVLVSELALGWLIRDNLTLNVLMLIHPIESIKAWQAGSR